MRTGVVGRRAVLTVGALLLQSGLIAYLLYRGTPSDSAPCWVEWSHHISNNPNRLAFAPPGGSNEPSLKLIKKAVVMGMATGYRWQALRNFVVSLRYTQFTGDVVLFVSPDAQSDDGLMQRLRFYNVTAVVVSPQFPYFEKGSLPYLMIERLVVPPMPELKAMNRRFHIMQLWLMAYGSLYSNVMISDTRDVVFQLDPFAWHGRKMEDKLYVAIENPWFTIEKHGINAGWVRLALGPDGFNKIKDEKISCSGTTYGSTEQMLWYLRRMNSWIGQVTITHRDRERKEGETVDRDIFDQAIHNYIIYQLDWDDKLELMINAKSPVLTVGSFGEFKSRTPPLQVLNEDGLVANVLHQYDRFEEISKTLDTRYYFLERQSFNFNVSLITVKVRQ